MHEGLPKEIAARASRRERVDVMAGKNVDTVLPLQRVLEPATAEGKP
jgi:hypothetical protein